MVVVDANSKCDIEIWPPLLETPGRDPPLVSWDKGAALPFSNGGDSSPASWRTTIQFPKIILLSWVNENSM